MILDRVTFTGADESVTPEAILRCAEEFPLVQTEWALLLSAASEGWVYGYPSVAWMEEFIRQALPSLAGTQKPVLTLAGHLQGRWLRAMGEGKAEFPRIRPTIWPFLQRFQMNFHGAETVIHPGFYTELMDPFKQFIFQMDGVNESVYYEAVKQGVNIVPLFDQSWGQGIVPQTWPRPVHPELNGYAGGLSPLNIKEQLKRLADTVGDARIWIDMESGIRTENRFDLDKCRRVLEAVVSNLGECNEWTPGERIPDHVDRV